jgi:hypothetical protein
MTDRCDSSRLQLDSHNPSYSLWNGWLSSKEAALPWFEEHTEPIVGPVVAADCANHLESWSVELLVISSDELIWLSGALRI